MAWTPEQTRTIGRGGVPHVTEGGEAMAHEAKPDDYPAVIPYLIVADPAATIDFLAHVFGAVETERMAEESGAIRHAEVRIGASVIMLGGARAEWPAMPCMNYVYVPDTDAAYERALEAGGTSVMAPVDQFYGDRNAGVKSPDGNLWWIATRIEDVSPDEMERRYRERAKADPAA